MTASDADTLVDPLQELEDSVAVVARMVTGDDDRAFVQLFQAMLNMADRSSELLEKGKENLGPAVMGLPRSDTNFRLRGHPSIPRVPFERSLSANPVVINNTISLIAMNKRIVGGTRTPQFPDCVAIGTTDSWCCSGTLVAHNLVVTAAHCTADPDSPCASRVFVGDDVNKPNLGDEIWVEEVFTHPDYVRKNPHADVAALRLARDAAPPPRPIASAKTLRGAATIRLAGFGTTDVYGTAGYGSRLVVDVPAAPLDPAFQAEAETEFVAGEPLLDRDSCRGDSGGPAYVLDGGSWRVAGATSRGVPSAVDSPRICGDGGIYTRLDFYKPWLRSISGIRWP